jgi:pimeloyl-ACP methyl ester carboxylesterase
MHTLNHPDCERVTLIGHSLGSATALDTLSRLGREIRAELDGTELDGTELDGTEPKTPPNSAILEAQNTQKSLVETL